MKTFIAFSYLIAVVAGLNACTKNSVDPTSADASARTSSVASGTLSGSRSLTAVEVSSLPATITSYISTNYAGATLKQAKKDAIGNYVVVITVNSAVKLLLFKADGTFVKEADGRPKHTAGDSTHHPKSGDSTRHHFPGDSTHHMPSDTTHRPKSGPGGPGLTEVAVSSLPATLTSYISTNYAGATINRAAQEKKTSDYVVVITTSDKKLVALLFGSDGTFRKVVTGRK